MSDFCVEIEGVTSTGPKHPEQHDGCQARWVLAVDPVGDMLLVAHEDRSLHWHPTSACAFARMRDPLGIQPVTVMEPPKRIDLSIPGANGPTGF